MQTVKCEALLPAILRGDELALDTKFVGKILLNAQVNFAWSERLSSFTPTTIPSLAYPTRGSIEVPQSAGETEAIKARINRPEADGTAKGEHAHGISYE